jgi:hypothetical protein
MSQFSISNFANVTTIKMNDNDAKIIKEPLSLEAQSKFSSLDDADSNLNLKSEKDNNSDINRRKNHNCPYCDRSFTRPYRLNDHISFSHTDEVSDRGLFFQLIFASSNIK